MTIKDKRRLLGLYGKAVHHLPIYTEYVKDLKRRKTEQVKEAEQPLMIHSPTYDGMPRSRNGDQGEQLAKLADKLRSIESRYDSTIEQYKLEIRTMKKTIKYISEIIAAVPDPVCRYVLENRFITPKTWREIAQELDLSESYCRIKLLNKALESLPIENFPGFIRYLR